MSFKYQIRPIISSDLPELIELCRLHAELYLYMDCLYIRAEARSKGIGEALIERIKMEAVGKDN